jgi:hypothetical protein
MWDDRGTAEKPKRNPKAPDFKCKRRGECDGVIWPAKEGATAGATSSDVSSAALHASTRAATPPGTNAVGDVPACPKCSGRMWDNRLTKKNPKQPDFKCRDRTCMGVVWPSPSGAAPIAPAAPVAAEGGVHWAVPQAPGSRFRPLMADDRVSGRENVGVALAAAATAPTPAVTPPAATPGTGADFPPPPSDDDWEVPADFLDGIEDEADAGVAQRTTVPVTTPTVVASSVARPEASDFPDLTMGFRLHPEDCHLLAEMSARLEARARACASSSAGERTALVPGLMDAAALMRGLATGRFLGPRPLADR